MPNECDIGPKEALRVCGVDVFFPHAPYKPQRAMLHKIISTLKAQKSVLLESPTGSGKTLALLCSAIAWQQNEYAKLEKELICQRDMQMNAKNGKILNDEIANGIVEAFNFDDEDFKAPLLLKHRPSIDAAPVDCPVDLTDIAIFREKVITARKSVPRIYFGSRTHKQLLQVVRELKKTSFASTVRMSILGSRQQACVHKAVRSTDDKAEACRQLLRGESTIGTSCEFYSRLKKFDNSPRQLRNSIAKMQKKWQQSVIGVWDMEEIVDIGFEQKFCPYFALTGVLLQDADIVFCPYNYLIDPLVRNRMRLNLNNQVVIIDEAHNIEDSCRESCSFSIAEKELRAEKENLDFASKDPSSDNPSDAYAALAEICGRATRFMNLHAKDTDEMKEQSFGRYYRVWSSAEIVVQLKNHFGIDRNNFGVYLKFLRQVAEFNNDGSRTTDTASTSGRQQRPVDIRVMTTCVESLFMFIDYFFRDNLKFMEDFKMGLTLENPHSFATSRSSSPNLTLKIWCLNPAVAFSDIGPKAWSVVLASGTLSPLDTFESELGVPFEFRLEADQVLSPDRMLVRSIGSGPNGQILKAVYGEIYTHDFLDGLGSVLLSVCKVVPSGVLCFCPSYKFLDTAKDRWTATRLWSKIDAWKKIVVEPRLGYELSESMTEFYEAVQNPLGHSEQCTGALLLAVYRGKIAEGLDFADDHARAVVCVGIPFPSVYNIEVDLKKKFNDLWCSKRKLLSGQQWYEVQAYRALNQALGRCLRHRQDWGALLLVDQRFEAISARPNKLSKWIRDNLKHRGRFDDYLQELTDFSQKFSTFVCPSDPSDSCETLDNDQQLTESRQLPRLSSRRNVTVNETPSFVKRGRFAIFNNSPTHDENQTSGRTFVDESPPMPSNIETGDASRLLPQNHPTSVLRSRSSDFEGDCNNGQRRLGRLKDCGGSPKFQRRFFTRMANPIEDD